jgi:hypothetical protein
MTLEARRYGVRDMKKFVKLLEEVPTDIVFTIFEEESQKLARLVVAEINSQPFWWEPLNETYRSQKDRAGLNTEMLKATEEYVQSIGIQEARRGKNSFSIRIGVPNRVHASSNLNFNDLGRIHEFGTQRIPARPHWGPVMNRWKKNFTGILSRVRGRVSKRLQVKFKQVFSDATTARVIR